VQHLYAIGLKTAVKIHHAEKTLQLFDVLRGEGRFHFGGVTGRGSRSCCRNRVAKNLQRGHSKNTFFEIDGETIGGQGIENSFQMAELCLPVQRIHRGDVHVCKHTFQTVRGAVHHSLKSLRGIRQPKWREQILKQGKWRDNLYLFYLYTIIYVSWASPRPHIPVFLLTSVYM
jgi:hypothetical protein